MLKPTVYLPSRSPSLTEAWQRSAQASLEALVAHGKREAERDQAEPRDPSPEGGDVVAAVGGHSE